MVLEASIEKYLRDEVKLRGGRAVKLHPSGAKGIPDRLIILPGALFFVELKRPSGGVLDTLQRWWHTFIRRNGHSVHVIRTKEQVDDLLAAYPIPG